MSRVLSAVLFLLLALAPVASPGRELVVVTLESPPLEYLENDRALGLNVDIARECLRRMGHEMKVVFVPWRRALQMAFDGEADAILDAGWSAERAKLLYYPAEPIYLEEVYAFKMRDKPYTLDEGLLDASKYRVGVGRGHYYGPLVAEAMHDGRLNVEEVAEMENNILKLVHDRIDMFLGVRLPFEYVIRRMGLTGRIDIVRKTGTDGIYLLDTSPTFLAFSRRTGDEALARRFGEVLLELKRDGTVDRFRNIYR